MGLSVVIPAYNEIERLPPSLNAVKAYLAQNYSNWEIIGSDDGSTDGTTARACDGCAGPRVKVIHQDNAGLPASRNRGAEQTASTYLTFLDADDWLLPGAVATLAAAVEAEERAGRDADLSHAFGQQQLAELGRGVWRVADWDPVLLMITNTQPVTCLVRRDRFEAVGGFDESMTDGYEDWDMWLRFASRGWRGVRVRTPVYVWRRHSTDTMVHRAIAKHEQIYRRLIDNHWALYDRLGHEAAVRSNVMLRRFDANWIDETGYPISHQVLYSVRESYERMTAVRLHHALRRWIDRLPRPIAAGVLASLALMRRFAPPPKPVGRV